LGRLLQTVRKRDFDLRPRRRIFAMVEMAQLSRSRVREGGQRFRSSLCWWIGALWLHRPM
jgi:hypothetical protein